MAIAQYSEQSIDAVPPTEEKGTEPAPSDTASDTSDESNQSDVSASIFTPAVAGITNITYRVVRFYTAPIRFMFSFMPFNMPTMPLPKFVSLPPSSSPELDDVSEKHVVADPEHPHANGSASVADINPVCQ